MPAWGVMVGTEILLHLVPCFPQSDFIVWGERFAPVAVLPLHIVFGD